MDYNHPKEEDRQYWQRQASEPEPGRKPGAKTRAWEMNVSRAREALRILDERRELRARGIEPDPDRSSLDDPW